MISATQSLTSISKALLKRRNCLVHPAMAAACIKYSPYLERLPEEAAAAHPAAVPATAAVAQLLPVPGAVNSMYRISFYLCGFAGWCNGNNCHGKAI